MSDRLKMHTPNKADENFKKLAALFPNAVTQTIDEFGEVVRAIDKDILMQEISTTVVEGKDERYQFTWPDKKKSILLANAPINKTLRPCREESVNFDTTENLYIEGDNLEVLKLLQETYLGKVKLIYIDPPYNTGNDNFVYDDAFSISEAEFSSQSGKYDDNGNILFDLRVNNESNGRFHTDWLNMMYPRLKIAKNLLKDDGVICIQIDDNEICNMKKICDEIFGAENFMTTIVVKMSEATGVKMSHATTRLPKLKEYVLVYKKGKETLLNSAKIPKDKWDNEYNLFLKNVTEKEIEFIKAVRDNAERTTKEIQNVDRVLSKISFCNISEAYKENAIKTEEQKNEFNINNSWRIIRTVSMSGGGKKIADAKKTTVNQMFYCIETPQKKMYFIKGDYSDNSDQPRIKILFADDYLTVNPCDFWQDIKTTGLENEGYVDFRNGKKPMKLVSRIIKIFSNENDIVMDFFSGSGTTGNAVLQFNKDEQTNRKFILVQLPENIDKQTEKADPSTKKDLQKTIAFLDSINKPHLISEIGKERLRLAGKDINYGDYGFRVLKCDSSNMKDVYYNPQDVDPNMFEDQIDNIKEDRTPEDLLFQVMLDLGVLLSSKIEETTIAGKKVFNVAEGFLIACFDADITEEVVTEIAKKQPYYFVTRDKSMANDNVATNFEQIFATYSPDTVRKVL